MLSEMSLTQLREWLAYMDLEPFDEQRQDIRFATLMSLLANINRDSKKRPKPFEIVDFMLRFGDWAPPPKPRKTWQELKAIARMIVKASQAEQRRFVRKPAKPKPSRPDPKAKRGRK